MFRLRVKGTDIYFKYRREFDGDYNIFSEHHKAFNNGWKTETSNRFNSMDHIDQVIGNFLSHSYNDIDIKPCDIVIGEDLKKSYGDDLILTQKLEAVSDTGAILDYDIDGIKKRILRAKQYLWPCKIESSMFLHQWVNNSIRKGWFLIYSFREEDLEWIEKDETWNRVIKGEQRLVPEIFTRNEELLTYLKMTDNVDYHVIKSYWTTDQLLEKIRLVEQKYLIEESKI